MGRSRSSSSDEKSSRRSKKSKKRSRNRSSSREESSSRRDKRSHRSRSRSRDRRRSRSKERRRSRSRDRRRSRSRERRGRSRSYSPRAARRRSRSRSSSSSSLSSKSSRPNKKKSRDRKNPDKENQGSKMTELSAHDMDRIAREAADIDQSDKFESKAFVSSSGFNQPGKENSRGASKSDTDFTFGTAGETPQVEKFLAQINEEGLCHPKLFETTKEKEDAYIMRIFQLRQKIAAERKSKEDY